MGRRARAAGFASAAAICAGLAAGASGGAAGDLPAQLGQLREVVAATRALPARRTLGRTAVAEALEIRRVPASFVAPDALTSPAQALGRRPLTTIPAGGYLLASQFRAPRQEATAARPELGANLRPVEITVTGAGPLAGAPGARRRVDVVVTNESGPTGGAGRTFVAAEAVALLELRPASGDDADAALAGPTGESWIATLALTRAQALRLIHAESFARDLRLIEV